MARTRKDAKDNQPEPTLNDELQKMSDAAPDPVTTVEAAEEVRGFKPSLKVWTTRTNEPKYRKFVDRDETRREQIFFKFDLPPGQTKPSEELMEAIRTHKKTAEGYPTGLKFTQDRIHGPVWKLPNTPEGRTTAMLLEMDLDKLATKLEGQSVA
jgi:hypothetical protein